MVYRHLIRPILFRFDPEVVHDKVSRVLARHRRWVAASRPLWTYAEDCLVQNIWGLKFSNPVGLAAGFDKWGRGVPVWPDLGFGFAEIGTITAEAQAGNDKPRLFRLTDDQALINRLGFNNDGAEETARTLANLRQSDFLSRIPVGINIGKSRSAPMTDAPRDYLATYRILWPFAAFVTVNVSSPNTPNLRDLQEKERLGEIVGTLQTANGELAKAHGTPRKPLLVKLAPDITDGQLDDILKVVERHAVDGIVAANTTTSRSGLRSDASMLQETGGLSGKPLRIRTLELIRTIRAATRGRITVVGVGGLSTGRDAFDAIQAGASLLQVYTGFVYEGPRLCRRINRELARLLRANGFRRLSEAVGTEPRRTAN